MSVIHFMVREMNHKEVQKFLEPQFGLLAKSNGEQLWMHHYTVWSVFKKLVRYIPSIDEEEEKILEIVCLLHDIEKKKESYQRIFRSGSENRISGGHKPNFNEILEYLHRFENIIPFQVTEETAKKVYDIILTHHSTSEKNVKEINTSSAGVFTQILKYSDWLASMESVSPRTINEIRKGIGGLFDLVYFDISRFPSPTTYLFLDEMIKVYKAGGWETLLVFDGGAIFIGEGHAIPDKGEMVGDLLEKFFDRSLGLQNIYSPNFTKNIIGGLSELFPAQFIKAGDHEQVLKDNLGDVDRKGVQFLRLLYDIINMKRGELSKLKRELPLWDLIPSCLGPSGHPKAKRQWPGYFDEDPPDSINAVAINRLLEQIKVTELIPKRYEIEGLEYDEYLYKLSSDNLFSILFNTAEYVEKEVADTNALKEYLYDTLSMEEINDFKKIAEERFEKYKIYKKTTNASKGICERCGCPISVDAKPALKYRKGTGYGFSQIKANPKNARSTCPLCAYDNMAMREGLRDADLSVLVRIESRIPEIARTYPKLEGMINVLKNGLQYPRQIIKLEEKEGLMNLPFPKRITIPAAKQDYGDIEAILTTERGNLFRVERMRDFSPKDYRVKYEPLYHVLNLLGFETSIGTEEQIGIFGEQIITTEEEYYRSLAVIILANVLDKDQKKYIFAKNLLEQSPSVALRFASETQKKSNKLRINEKLAERFFEFLYKSGIILFKTNGDEYIMKDLLKDAAFLADKDTGIPHFCVEPEDRGKFWKGLTRHKASKPISDALNEMLKSSDEGAFQRAIAAFIRNLSKKIPKKELPKQNEFVEGVKDILEKFWELRKEDISEFIRNKNAFTSTVFVLTRYSNLKEVFKDD